VSRPPVAEARLAGPVRYQLTTPHRGGTTHLLLEPLTATLAIILVDAQDIAADACGSSRQAAAASGKRTPRHMRSALQAQPY